MFELTLLIPTADNDGVAFDGDDFVAFEARAIDLFGGVTRLDGLARGSWVEAGVVYGDTSRVYAVAVASITDGAKVAELVEFAKAHFRQLAIYVRFLGIAEIL